MPISCNGCEHVSGVTADKILAPSHLAPLGCMGFRTIMYIQKELLYEEDDGVWFYLRFTIEGSRSDTGPSIFDIVQ